jgi:acetoin utilization deacetylase AcuC-like enzyme
MRCGALDARAQRRLGFPWSEALVLRSRLAVAGTLEAARMALRDGLAANLAGGTHHAFPDHGEGFCVFNDVAVAIRSCRAERRIARALVVDLDVHQGNGTAAIFCADPLTYTFSMHGANNFPLRKERSSRDVELPDGTGDDQYLSQLRAHLPEVIGQARAELCFYVAGVDPVRGDRLGRLALSREGLALRERLVLEELARAGIPAAIVMGGGYAATPLETAELHAVVHREARALRASAPSTGSAGSRAGA